MGFALQLSLKDGSVIESPAIAPDTMHHTNWDSGRILSKIARLGKEIVELDPDVVGWKPISKERV